MNINTPSPKDMKLCVIYRVEPGCLGPEGLMLINEFCLFAQNNIRMNEANFIIWEIHSRSDKTLPEMEYKLNNKKLSHDKAKKYLEILDIKINELEEHFHEELSNLVEEYFQNK